MLIWICIQSKLEECCSGLCGYKFWLALHFNLNNNVGPFKKGNKFILIGLVDLVLDEDDDDDGNDIINNTNFILLLLCLFNL